MKTDEMLADAWADGRVPALDCVVHRNGRMTLLETTHFKTEAETAVRVRPIADTTLSSYLGYNPDGLTYIEPMVHENGSGWSAMAGAGSMGSDGFVALLDDQDRLAWVVFSGSSEAFFSVERTGAFIRARAADGRVWVFSIASPEHITVE